LILIDVTKVHENLAEPSCTGLTTLDNLLWCCELTLARLGITGFARAGLAGTIGGRFLGSFGSWLFASFTGDGLARLRNPGCLSWDGRGPRFGRSRGFSWRGP
jgi:hypothetical protein